MKISTRTQEQIETSKKIIAANQGHEDAVAQKNIITQLVEYARSSIRVRSLKKGWSPEQISG